MPRRWTLCYRDALQWIINNDDTEWLHDDDPVISVTAALVADIYDRSTDEVIADLKKRYVKEP
jgi:hypothetical protein